MEDVITDIPPPSRFLLEDLNNFTPPQPPLPSPFLVFSSADSKNFSLSPSILIIAMSTPSLHLLHHLSPKNLIASLILPEIPFAGNSIKPSLKDKSCKLYALEDTASSIMIALVQFPVTSERAHVVAKQLIGEKIVPKRVLILDTIERCNFRGKLPPDETIAFKLETSLERKCSDTAESSLFKGVDYYPSGSMVDGLGAALLSRCELKKIRAILCVTWPDLGLPVMSLVKSLLGKDVLTNINYSIDENYKDEYLRLTRGRKRIDSDLYT